MHSSNLEAVMWQSLHLQKRITHIMHMQNTQLQKLHMQQRSIRTMIAQTLSMLQMSNYATREVSSAEYAKY